MRVLVVLLTGCVAAPEPGEFAPVETEPREVVEMVRTALKRAADDWKAGQYEDARAGVYVTYMSQFEPWEPALRIADPVHTTELEYAFGRLAVRMGEDGDATEMSKRVGGLVGAVEVSLLAVAP